MRARFAVPLLSVVIVFATVAPARSLAQQGGPATPPPTVPIPTPIRLPAANLPLGITVPDAAKTVLTQQELVEGVCLMSRWRAQELFAAVDAVTATQPRAQASLDAVGIRYPLPNPADFRSRASAALDAICAAPTVDESVRLTAALIQVNVEMEAKYGALAEALGGDVRGTVQQREDRIRADIDVFAQRRAKEEETSLRAQAEGIAAPIAEETKPRYEAMITARAQGIAAAIAPTVKSEAEARAIVEAQLQPFIDAKVAEAKAEVTAKVEAALKTRIENSRALITDEANKMAEAMAQSTIVGPMRAVQEAFDAMLLEVEARVDAARKADSPAKRAAVDARVRLGMKTADAHLGDARRSVEAARAELAALKAANPAAADADALLRRLDASRATLERDLRAAAAAGDETAFTAAYTGLEAAWRQVAAELDAAAGVWTSARVCQEATPSLQQALVDAEAAGGEVTAALGPLARATAPPDQAERLGALRASLEATRSRIAEYSARVRQLQQACAAPGGDPRPLIALLDELRRDQYAVRQSFEASRLLAQSMSR